jgi:hypothetical protein
LNIHRKEAFSVPERFGFIAARRLKSDVRTIDRAQDSWKFTDVKKLLGDESSFFLGVWEIDELLS